MVCLSRLLCVATLLLTARLAAASALVLQAPVAMETVDADLVTLDPGIYTVSESGESQLDITSAQTLNRIRVRANRGEHDEKIDFPLAMLVPVAQGPLHVLLLLPNGVRLEAVAGPSDVTTRGPTLEIPKQDVRRYSAATRPIRTQSDTQAQCPRCEVCPPPMRCPECPTCSQPSQCPEPPECPVAEPCPNVREDASPVTDLEPWMQQMLDAHNELRASTESPNGPLPPLEWDATIATVAQNYVDTCPGMIHNPNRNTEYLALLGRQPPGWTSSYALGENIAAHGSSNPDAILKSSINAWSQEEASYNYAANSCSGQTCGHYTQMVWRGSAKLGCGVKTDCASGGWSSMIVCNYFPPGNFNNQRPH